MFRCDAVNVDYFPETYAPLGPTQTFNVAWQQM